MLIIPISFSIRVDGDLITIMDSSDLNVAKQISRLLKITLFSEYEIMKFKVMVEVPKPCIK